VGAVAKALVDVKGDLITATADNTPARLAAGSNGQILMADSSATAGLRYVDPPTNRNLIINGAANVHQRGTSSTGITGNGYYTADRWSVTASSLGTWTQTVETDGPTGTPFKKSLKMLCTTADASPSADDVILIDQKIEGQNLLSTKSGTSSAEQLTLSFWVKSNVTGTYVAGFVNTDAGNRIVSATYSVSQSATWERKVITFPADTAGGYDNDNTIGVSLQFWLAGGTSYTSGTLATTWQSLTQANRAVGQTNLAAATNNYWQVTGVQLETGPVATPFEFEPYEATLRKCQRYYVAYRSDESSSGLSYARWASGQNQTTTNAQFSIDLPVTMRTPPSLVQTSTASEFGVFANNVITALSAAMGINSHRQVMLVSATVASGLTAGHGSQLLTNNNRNAAFAFDAEL
jgi:hypothetical protein